jgi:hypothetical protein
MNTSPNITLTPKVENGYLVLKMWSDLEICFPIARNPRLANGAETALKNIEVSPFGLHWPDLDEDLAFADLAEGHYGQK